MKRTNFMTRAPSPDGVPSLRRIGAQSAARMANAIRNERAQARPVAREGGFAIASSCGTAVGPGQVDVGSEGVAPGMRRRKIIGVASAAGQRSIRPSAPILFRRRAIRPIQLRWRSE